MLFSLWPVPPEASKLFMKNFYTALLQGYSATKALADAMKKVQGTKQFSHPSNWASWVLVGNDVKLSSKVSNRLFLLNHLKIPFEHFTNMKIPNLIVFLF